MTPRFCTCKAPSTALVEGVLVCEKCGEEVQSEREAARDKLLVLVVRQQREILERLTALEEDRAEQAPSNGNRNGNGSARQHLSRPEQLQIGEGP